MLVHHLNRPNTRMPVASKLTLLQQQFSEILGAHFFLIFIISFLIGNPCLVLQCSENGKFILRAKCSFLTQHVHEVCAKSFQSCPTFCDPMDCSPPGSSVHGILQARILEWVAMPSARGSSRPRDLTLVSYISYTAGGFFTTSVTGEAH